MSEGLPSDENRTEAELAIRELGHNLRNCLYTIKTGLDLIRRRELDKDTREVLELMSTDQEMATRTLQELIDVARAVAKEGRSEAE